MAMRIALRCSAMPSASNQNRPAFGLPMKFDFSSDVGAGERIYDYAVALSGFHYNYYHAKPAWAQNFGAMSAAFSPSLIGSIVTVVANLEMTDLNLNYGRTSNDPEDDGNPATTAYVTVIVLVGPEDDHPTAVVGNIFGLPRGEHADVPVDSNNPRNMAFLAGFGLRAAHGDTFSGLSLEAEISSSVRGKATVSGSALTRDIATSGAVDLVVLSLPPDVGGYAVEPATIALGKPDKTHGMTGSISANFSLPANTKIRHAALLLQSVRIDYDDNDAFQLIEAMQTAPLKITSSSVAGTFNLNIYNPDFLSKSYIADSSQVLASIFVQLG